MKLNIELYLKVDFLGTGGVYKRPITGMGKETHGYSHILVVLVLRSRQILWISDFFCDFSPREA